MSERSVSPIPSQAMLRSASATPAAKAEKRKSNLNELIQQEAERSGVGRLVGVVETPVEKRGLSMSQEIQRLKMELRSLHIEFENKETECKQYRRAMESNSMFAEYEKVRAENLELMKANNVSFDGRDDTEYQRLKQEIRDLNDVVADQMTYIDEQNSALGEAAKDVEAGEKYIKSLERKVDHLEKTKMTADQVFRENVKVREENKALGKKLVAIHKAMASHAIQNQYESFMSTGGFRHSDSIESELSEQQPMQTPARPSGLPRRASTNTEGTDAMAYIQSRYAVSGSFNKGGNLNTPKTPSPDIDPQSGLRTDAPNNLSIEVSKDEKPRVGDIGDAEVNAKSYKVQLLRAERAIRSLSQRNELVESELCAMHTLLRCVYLIDMNRSQNNQRVELLSKPTAARCTTPPPSRESETRAKPTAPTPKRTSLLRSASKFIKGKDKDQDKEKERGQDTSYSLYDHSSTNVATERDSTHSTSLYRTEHYTELWVAANVAKVGYIDRSFEMIPNEFAIVEYCADSKLKNQLFEIVQASNTRDPGGDPSTMFTYANASSAVHGLKSSVTETYEYLFHTESSAPLPLAAWPSTAAKSRPVSPKRSTSPIPGAVAMASPARSSVSRFKPHGTPMTLTTLKAAICSAEHILMGWDVVRHKDKKKTESGVYHADMTARCLVWTSVEDINDMDGGRDSTSFPFPLSGFTSSDAEKERKRRVMFSEIVDLTKGIVSELSSGLTSDVVRSASRVLTLTHTSPQSESIVKTLYLEFMSEDDRDAFYEGMNCLLSKVA